MEIKFITADETLPLRSLQLRDGWALERCRFESDLIAGAMHLGVFVDDKLVCILSLHPQEHEKLAGQSYQLRGMATHPEFLGKGYGKHLIRYATALVRERGPILSGATPGEMPILFTKSKALHICRTSLKSPLPALTGKCIWH